MKSLRHPTTFWLSALSLFLLVALITSQTRADKTSNLTGQDGAKEIGDLSAVASVNDSTLTEQCVQPPNTTMVAWYPFDETAGTSSANLATGNQGALKGGPTPTAGKVAGALGFDGVDDYVEAPSTIVTNIGPAGNPQTCSGLYSTCRGDFSIDAWVLVDSTAPTTPMIVVDKRSGIIPNIKGYSFFVEQNRLSLQMADSLGAAGFTTYFSPVISGLAGAWHHIAVTVSRQSSSGINWYDNGLNIGSSDPTVLATRRYGSLANNSPLRIGTRTAATPLSGWFKGKIDELEIFNRVLEDQEVLEIFKAGPAGKCKHVKSPPNCSGCKLLSDFDGDGRDDIAVFRPSNGVWYSIDSSTGTVRIRAWGQNGDKIVPGDYDGDGKADNAVFRPSTGEWFINSSNSSVFFGTGSDIPVAMDYDGDGKTDIAVWRPGSPPTWLILQSGGGLLTVVTPTSNSGDIPVPADYDGDCKADLAVWRPSNGTWYLFDHAGNVIQTQQLGQAGDIPVPADYDGDGKTDFAIWRPSNGMFSAINSGGGTTMFSWGEAGDKPVPGCYDGDNKTDFAVFRPSTGVWYLHNSDGTVTVIFWGMAGDIPVPGAYISGNEQ